MPLYEYVCGNCRRRFEKYGSMKEGVQSELPCDYGCGGTGHRVYSFNIGKKGGRRDYNDVPYPTITKGKFFDIDDELGVFVGNDISFEEASSNARQAAEKMRSERIIRLQKHDCTAEPSDD